ncbi:MAG: fibronectin type III domain-containing protein, partial [Bdellovibrionota bacterium]
MKWFYCIWIFMLLQGCQQSHQEDISEHSTSHKSSLPKVVDVPEPEEDRKPDHKAPTAPFDVKIVTQDTTSITLSWQAAEDDQTIAKDMVYIIFTAEKQVAEVKGETQVTIDLDTLLPKEISSLVWGIDQAWADQTIVLFVQAKDQMGNASAPSVDISIAIPDLEEAKDLAASAAASNENKPVAARNDPVDEDQPVDLSGKKFKRLAPVRSVNPSTKASPSIEVSSNKSPQAQISHANNTTTPNVNLSTVSLDKKASTPPAQVQEKTETIASVDQPQKTATTAQFSPPPQQNDVQPIAHTTVAGLQVKGGPVSVQTIPGLQINLRHYAQDYNHSITLIDQITFQSNHRTVTFRIWSNPENFHEMSNAHITQILTWARQAYEEVDSSIDFAVRYVD